MNKWMNNFARLFRLFRERNSGGRLYVIATSLLVEQRLQDRRSGEFTNRRVLPDETGYNRSCVRQVIGPTTCII